MQCSRCDGLVVADYFVSTTDLIMSSIGEPPCYRCVICGDITDSLIDIHRIKQSIRRQFIR